MRGVGRDRGGAAQGDRNVGLLQRDRVVDTVADEADFAALLLKFFDIVGLVGRQNLGEKTVHAELLGKSTGWRFLVAGNDRDVLDAPRAKSLDDLGHLWTNRGSQLQRAAEGII